MMKPMRLEKREMKERRELMDVLRDGTTLHIAFRDDDGIAVFPVNYGYREIDGLVELAFHGAVGGRKAAYFAAHSRVSFELEVPEGLIIGSYACAYSFAYRSLMGKGDVRIVRDDEEKQRCLDLLLDHVTGSAARRTYSPQSLLLTNVYVLSVTEMTGKRRS